MMSQTERQQLREEHSRLSEELKALQESLDVNDILNVPAEATEKIDALIARTGEIAKALNADWRERVMRGEVPDAQ